MPRKGFLPCVCPGGGGYARVPTEAPEDRTFVAARNVAPADSWQRRRVAAGKALTVLQKIENEGYCEVEKTSVYGVAIAMPQIARSVGWPTTVTGLATRAFVLLALNYTIQGFLIAMMQEVAQVMNPNNGQMHLCDFGSSIWGTEDIASLGPAGTRYDLPRLFAFQSWSTRCFVRDSLKALFPQRASDVALAADCGEYGLEDYYCRLVCCLIFTMDVAGDFFRTIGMGRLLWCLPSAEEPWVGYEVPDGLGKEKAKTKMDFEYVTFRVAGMPRTWKIFNAITILCPKVCLWCLLVQTGVHFLMETAGIMDLVVNCMALSFVLGIDELIFEQLGTLASKSVMDRLENYALFDIASEDEASDREVEEWLDREEFQGYFKKLLCKVVPGRFLVTLGMLSVLLFKYYFLHCHKLEDGSYVSREIYLRDRGSGTNPFEFAFANFFLNSSKLPVWSMPDD